MSLKSQLDALRSEVKTNLPPGAFDRLQAESNALRESGLLRKSLRAGDIAPDFKLCDEFGSRVRLYDLLKVGPVVICFYRGDWCQFCNLQIAALEKIANEIRESGASLVAISPQFAQTSRTSEIESRHFPVLVDAGAKVSKRYGISFMPKAELRKIYTALGRPEHHEGALPVPATYVIDQSERIQFSCLDTDFTQRLEPAEILIVLRAFRMAYINHDQALYRSNVSHHRRKDNYD